MTVLKTLVIVYDPVVDASTGKKLSQYMRWNSVEELAKGYMSDILEVSGGLARHQIIQRIDVDDFPVKVNGYRYDANTYLSVVRGAAPPYMPQEANYHAIIERLISWKAWQRTKLTKYGFSTFHMQAFTNPSWVGQTPSGAMPSTQKYRCGETALCHYGLFL